MVYRQPAVSAALQVCCPDSIMGWFVYAAFSADMLAAVPVAIHVQIGLFAVPFVTVVGWILGHPFSLGFESLAALVLLLSVECIQPT